MSKKVAIIGGGPMGLTCAYELSKKGIDVKVFEKDDKLGGMSASFDFGGVTIEKFYHFINMPDNILFNLLEELGIKDDLIFNETKMGFFRKDSNGTYNLYNWGKPSSLLLLHDIPFITRIRYGLHVYLCKFRKNLFPLDKISAKNWIEKWEGKLGYKLFWVFLFYKKFFEFADPLSSAWIASRIRRVANSRKSLAKEQLGYLKGGTQELIDSLKKKILENKGSVVVNAEVTSIEKQNNDFIISTNNNDIKERFDYVISTIPLKYLAKICPELPNEYVNKLNQLNNVGCACALFKLSSPLTENFWLNVDIGDWCIPGVIEYSNLRKGMDGSFVYIPLYMPKTHPNWNKNDLELLELCKEYLSKINPNASLGIIESTISRYEYAQPVCDINFMDKLPAYETGISKFLAADTSHSFPEDRSLNESIRIAKELAKKITL